MSVGWIDLFLFVLALANLYAFLRFWADKRAARLEARRTPETTLLAAALFGGFGAWLGQHLLRHKTRKEPFRSRLGRTIILHLLGVAGVVWWLLTSARPA